MIFVWISRSLGWNLSILLLHFQWLENGYEFGVLGTDSYSSYYNWRNCYPIEVEVLVGVLVEVLVEVQVLVLGIYAYTLDNRVSTVDNNARCRSFSFE